jgi:hypothetical protein
MNAVVTVVSAMRHAAAPGGTAERSGNTELGLLKNAAGRPVAPRE